MAKARMGVPLAIYPRRCDGSKNIQTAYRQVIEST